MEAPVVIDIVLSAVSAILGVVIVCLVAAQSGKRSRSGVAGTVLTAVEREGAATRDAVLGNLSLQNGGIQSALNGNLNAVAAAARAEAERSENFRRTIETGLIGVADQLKRSMESMRADNERQLDRMRGTVDEKLSATLDERFRASFGIVSKTLEDITRNVGEMKSLTDDVVDLRKTLTNVKTRGTWGEVSLDNLLSQLLTPEQYVRNFRPERKSTDEAVDFAVSMPGKEDRVYLPVDSKFPLSDYERIFSAQTMDEQAAARRDFEKAVKKQAQSISDKYIRPPVTTNFAVMYLPTEGLFAEVTRCPGLQDEIQRKYRVTVTSPTTLAAFLNCLQMGFKTVAIEKRSSDIWKLLSAFKKDFADFSEILVRTERQLTQVENTIRDAGKRTEIIKKRLSAVETDGPDSPQIADGTDGE